MTYDKWKADDVIFCSRCRHQCDVCSKCDSRLNGKSFEVALSYDCGYRSAEKLTVDKVIEILKKLKDKHSVLYDDIIFCAALEKTIDIIKKEFKHEL